MYLTRQSLFATIANEVRSHSHNNISYHFARYITTHAPDKHWLVQAKRLATSDLVPSYDNMGTIGSSCQFLAALLFYGGVTTVQEILSAPFYNQLIDRLKDWRSEFPFGYTRKTTERCLDMLNPSSINGPLRFIEMRMILGSHEKGFTTCATPGCLVKDYLMQCVR